jgi:hypothetical protein
VKIFKCGCGNGRDVFRVVAVALMAIALVAFVLKTIRVKREYREVDSLVQQLREKEATFVAQLAVARERVDRVVSENDMLEDEITQMKLSAPVAPGKVKVRVIEKIKYVSLADYSVAYNWGQRLYKKVNGYMASRAHLLEATARMQLAYESILSARGDIIRVQESHIRELRRRARPWFVVCAGPTIAFGRGGGGHIGVGVTVGINLSRVVSLFRPRRWPR